MAMSISPSSRTLDHFDMKKILTILAFVFAAAGVSAQTASSLFMCADSLQVGEIVSESGNEFDAAGHHGPAVENSHGAFCLYFNDSGAIDLYSKNGRGMELLRYKWNPTEYQRTEENAGVDQYAVGESLGFGGVALWDGSNVVRLVATGGRTARVGNGKKGSWAELIAYGVEYMGGKVDICIRLDVNVKTRLVKMTASELNGRKVTFVTSLNYYEGMTAEVTPKALYTWGRHPECDGVVGAGLLYNAKVFPVREKTDSELRLVSKPASKVSTTLVCASTLEAELNTQKRFVSFVTK